MLSVVILSLVMLNVIMLNVVMLSLIMLSVFMLSVMTSSRCLHCPNLLRKKFYRIGSNPIKLFSCKL
jgi:hypothetical protein